MRREADRLLLAEAQESAAGETLEEEAVHVILEGLVEVDEDVPAQDEVELVEGCVRDEVVLGEDEILLQALRDDRVVVGRRVVIGEGALPPRPGRSLSRTPSWWRDG